MGKRRGSGDRRRLTIVDRALAGVLIVLGLASLVLLVLHAADLLLLDEAGYGDSYILYDVLNSQRTGVIYRDLSQPPYLPAQYSPLVYLLYSIPGRIAAWDNPFVGPRLVALTSFLLCLGVVLSLVRALLPRWVWLWAVLQACSIAVCWDWVLQLRGDFPGMFFSLLAIRLLLSRSRVAVELAGICAGLAMQFKIILIAAPLAGAFWLLAQHRWKDLAKYAGFSAIASAGLYVFFLAREPRMLVQMFALSPAVVDLTEWFNLVSLAGREPVVLLSVLGMTSVVRRGPRWNLVLAFAVTSFVLGGVFVLQAGGNVNYFFEALFAAVPLATLGLIRFLALARREALVGVAATAFLIFYYGMPRTLEAYELVRARFVSGPGSVASRNQEFAALEHVLRGQHIFSTVPRLALIDAAPALMEPFLLTYMERLGKVDPRPLLGRVEQDEFDVVITQALPWQWRGLPHIAPDLRAAIVASYRPHCVVRGLMIDLPNHTSRDNSAFAQQLAHIGCMSVRSEPGASR